MDVAPVEVPAPGSPLRAPAELELDELAACARSLVGATSTDWTWHIEAPWAYVSPAGARLPDQGWKLHVAATEGSAQAVLAAVVPVLLAEGAPFKFAATKAYVRVLNSASAARASGGKFLTVYPLEDAQALRVAEACHRATAGLEGPSILSDRPYRPGSLVHYRYGGFHGQRAVDADGMVVHLIRDPSGELVPDERRAAYSAPPWAQDPFQPEAPPRNGGHPPSGGPVLLNRRYLVQGALRHANKGGTYLAEDGQTGARVVIKEGRPHVATSAGGGDARDRVRHEARMLERVAPVGRAPRLVEVFDQQGHVFLVEEHVPAPSLRDIVADAFDPPGPGLPAADVARFAARLAGTMAAFHAAGVVLRDFNPNNLLVGPGDELTLVDLELAHPLGEAPPLVAGTPGYASPEQLRGEPAGLPDDYWSLGATIAHVATGADPYLPAEVGHTWTDPDRLEAWMARQVTDGQVHPAIAGIVLGCMASRPEDRFGPGNVLGVLAAVDGRRRPSGLPRLGRAPARSDPGRLTEEHWLEASAGVAGWLVSALGTGTSGHLWPPGPSGALLDPANVQSGASGVGLFLCQAARALDDSRLPEAVSAAATWVSERVAREPKRPPGLYFGLSGAAWFLTEAAAVLGRDDILRRANELALALPVRVANPDLTHGTAGVGLGQLHQWRASGDDRFLARAMLAAEHLVRTAQRSGPGGDAAALTWPVPASAPGRLAGTISYGFAHGNAGIASFLLCAAGATGEGEFLAVALEALDALLPLAVEADGAAWWPTGPDDDGLWTSWCKGSSGIGTALVRAHAATGEERYRRAAEQCATAVVRERWRSSPVQCHGLAGDAELLLDLAAFLADDSRTSSIAGPRPLDPPARLGFGARYSALAADAAEALWLQRRRDGAFAVFADDTGAGVSAGFGTGVAGVGSFLLRFATGEPRPLMLDDLLPSRGTGRG